MAEKNPRIEHGANSPDSHNLSEPNVDQEQIDREGADAAIVAAIGLYRSLPGRQQLGLGVGNFSMFSSQDPALDFYGLE